MLTSMRGLSAATLSAGLFLSATPAFATEITIEDDSTVEANVIHIEDAASNDISDIDIGSIDAETLTLASAMAAKAAEPIAPDSASKVEGESGLTLSGNVALVTDYRFRGVSLSDGDPALQGGIDLGHSSGFYIGTWASTITGGTPFGEMELDVYGGWSGDVTDGLTFDVGLLYYIYPTGDFAGVDTDFFEPYASVSTTLGPVGATVGIAYAWEQDAIGGADNIYLYTDFEAAIPETPITLSAHLGYTDGVFATDGDGTSFDWGLGASWAVTDALSVGVNYVDTQGVDIEDFTDAGFFFTVGYSM